MDVSNDKDKKTDNNKPISTDNSIVGNEESNTVESAGRKDMDKKNDNKKIDVKKSNEKKNDVKKNDRSDNRGGNVKRNEHKNPDTKRNEPNRAQDANKPNNNRPGADKNRDAGRAVSKRPLEIPKVELSASQKEELNSQRAERRDFNKDAEKDSKRELKKEQPRAGINNGKNKNHKVIKNVLNTKKGVSEVLSDDFEMEEYYFNGSKRVRKVKKKKEEKQEEKYIPPKAVLTSIKISAPITVKELAEALKKTAAEVIKKLMALGIMATLNQELDFDTAAIVADEFGVKAEEEVVVNEEDILFDDSDDSNDPEAVPRPPVVVVMGHVDHGKTSLLDAIKKSNVTESEAGGITQHIGAYMVKINNRNITFLDTPGHEAFTAMRARGAQVTDVAILVVAADDGVMPQTVEAINHAKAANVTIIVAINKIDKPTANPDRVKQELAEYGLIPEEWGGDTICVEVSAKKRLNIDNLLEMVLLAADMLELKANPNKQAKGTVIEAKLDKDKGPVATVLVQRGTLNVGDSIIVGTTTGRIRAMTDDKGHRIKKAGPSTPVEILGMHEVPEAGEIFYAITDEKTAKQLIEKRKLKQREQQLKSTARVTLDDLFNQIKEGKVKDLNIIVKADVQGSVEALKQSLEKLSNDEVRIKIIHGGVGSVNESDVTLAQVSNAIIIGFNVRPSANVIDAAKKAGVDLRLYTIIYNAIEDIEAAMKGMLDPTYKEVVIGHVEIRQIFKVSGVGTIGGAYVTDGKIVRNCDIRLVRDGIVIHEGKLASLKRFKDDVKEVAQGYECGISIEKYNDIKEGDVIEAYVMEEVK
ncbi:translation initiation factor IF-2 [Acetivibrio straminisolvens]|uniref:translation initiation factor IF-2 n=1 Tax=Acetivibrio straminisolvens TaxID=253314 RepID=UPI001FB19E9F|nr:translation initiation factor IF-2 [Acetivibrio straminisolvens]